MDVTLIGATGLVGGNLLRLMENDSKIERIYAPTRKGLKGVTPKVEMVLTNFSDPLHYPTGPLFCCLGTTIKKAKSKEAFYKIEHDLVLQIAKDFKDQGGKEFIYVSALGVRESSPFFYNKVKAEIERDLEDLQFEKLIIVRPSLLLGERTEHRFFEEMAQKVAPLISKMIPKSKESMKPITGHDVALSMLELYFTGSRNGYIDYQIFSARGEK